MRSLRLLAAGLALLAFWTVGGTAEESGHERTGVRKKAAFELSLDTDATLRSLSADKGFDLDGNFGIECSWASKLGIGLDLPFSLRAARLFAASCRWGLLPGNLGLELSYAARLGDWRLMAGPSLGLPLVARDTALEKVFGSPPGSGYPSFGLVLSCSRYLDPLVLGIGFKAETCLPRAEIQGSSSIPISLSLVLSATEVLNERLCVAFYASPCVTGPRILAGAWDGKVWRYALSVGCYLRLMFGDSGLRLGLADFSAPALSLGLDRTFRFP